MNRVVFWLDDIINRKRWILHVTFWVVILLIYGIFFGRKNNNYFQTIFFVGLLMPVVISSTYFFNYFLIPRYVMTARYRLFFLYSFYTILIALFLEMMVSLFTLLIMAELRVQNMSPASVDIFFLLSSFLVVVFLGVAIKMVSFWQQSKNDYQSLMLEKIEMELKFLKAQLNPHFLFNTLNNLYYLASEKSDKAPQAILQLSEMLDYIMHSGKLIYVPLEDELKQVDNYIALELLRYGDRVEINNERRGILRGHMIGPMILITLIENAFKHGVMTMSGKSWIKLIVIADSATVNISLGNSYPNSSLGNGIGLNNLRNQLDHLYKDNYEIKIDTSRNNEFWVSLNIKNK